MAPTTRARTSTALGAPPTTRTRVPQIQIGVGTYVLESRVLKKCSRCGEHKQLSEFSLKKRATGLLHSFCRACHKAWNRKHYERNRATYIANARRNSAR